MTDIAGIFGVVPLWHGYYGQGAVRLPRGKITENADKCPGAEWFRDIFTVPKKGIPSLFLPERYCANGKHYDIVDSSKMGWFGDFVSHPEKEFEESDVLQQA
jgi:hypothetical protein